MRTGVEIPMGETYGLNSADLLIRAGDLWRVRPVVQGGMTGKLFFCPLFLLSANDESLDCWDVRK